MLKFLCWNPGDRLAFLREGGITVAGVLVKYFIVFVVSENLVEVDVAFDTNDLAASITAAVVVTVAFTDVVFDYDYIVCVAFDVVALARYVVPFVVVAVDDAGIPTSAHVDA